MNTVNLELEEASNEVKAEKFETKLDEIQNSEWNRDNFERKVNDLKSIFDTVEELITDYQNHVERLTQKKQQIKDDFGETDLEQFESEPLASGYNPTLKVFYDLQKEITEKKQDIIIFRSYQLELQRTARRKLRMIADGYKDDFTGSEVAQHTLDKVEEDMHDEFEKLEQRLENKIDKKTRKTENVVNAARNEIKFAHRFFENFGEALVEQLSLTDSQIEDFREFLEEKGSEFDDFADQDGIGVDLSGDAQNKREKKRERKQAEQSAASTGLGSSSSNEKGTSDDDVGGEDADALSDFDLSDDDLEIQLKNVSDEEKKNRLRSYWQSQSDPDVTEMSQRKISQDFDLTRKTLFRDGGTIDSLKKKYENGEFGESDGSWLSDFK